MEAQDAPLETQGPGDRAPRLHYLDWLRVLAIFGVFLFHASNVFNDQDFVIKNAEQSAVVTGIQAFFFPWGMPLFYMIAGAGTWFALRSRTVGEYVKERSNRLLIPFLVGCVLLSPVQVYLEWRYQVNAGVFAGSFTQFIGSLPWGPNPRILEWLATTCGSWVSCSPSRCSPCRYSAGLGEGPGSGSYPGWHRSVSIEVA